MQKCSSTSWHYEIDFQKLNNEEAREIVKHMNDVCSKNLLVLRLNDCTKDYLDELTNPFENVFYLVFSAAFNFNANLRLKTIFPNLKSLNVGQTFSSGGKALLGQFPKLTEVELDLSEHDYAETTEFLENNTQIEILKVKMVSQKLLRHASEHLKNLTTLEISLSYESNKFLNDDGDYAIELNTVKDLKIQSIYDGVLDKIVFDQVDTLHLSVDFKYGNWIPFIDNQVNRNLKSLTISSIELHLSDFSKIPKRLPYLQDVNITVSSNVKFDAETVITFIQKSKNLQKLEIVAEMDRSEQIDLKNWLLNDNSTTNIQFKPSRWPKVVITIEK